MLRSLALFFLAALAIAQEPLYRTGARLVTVDVTVRNSQGPVKGLTKDDFTVQDKGKPQIIAVFAMTDSAGTAVKGDPLPPGVVSNSANATGEAPRAATVILFDRLNIPRALDQAAVRTKVLEFLASLQPADRIGFYSLGTGLTMVQDFDEGAGPLAQAAKQLAGSAAGQAASNEIEAHLKGALTPIQEQDIECGRPSCRERCEPSRGISPACRDARIWCGS
jgi:VWFA-related protein